MVHSNKEIDVLVAVVLIFLTVPIARKVSDIEKDEKLYGLLMAAMVTHLVFCLASLYVVNHVYHGVTDYTRYVDNGAVLGRHFDRFDFTLPPNVATKVLGDGSVSIAAGVVFAIVGVNKIAGFFVFSWLAFLATICFYRAFSVTFPEANRRAVRVPRVLPPLPALLDVGHQQGSDDVPLAGGLGLRSRARCWPSAGAASCSSSSAPSSGCTSAPRSSCCSWAPSPSPGCSGAPTSAPCAGIRRILVMGLQAALLIAAVTLAQELGKHAPVFNLTKLSQNNAGEASSIAYHPGPAGYPRDIWTVLFDPLPYNAHGDTQKFAAFENTIILILILISLPRLRLLLRTAFLRPYVLLAVLYSAAWPYAFAALGNLGLIDRERIMLLPFLMIPLAIPVARKGSPKYEWELSSAQRRKRRQPQRRWSAGVGAAR